MWLLGFLLLPVVSGANMELKINGYLVKIVNDVLETIETTEQSASSTLNLAGLGIKNFGDRPFDNLTELRSLNLANNSLTRLRDGEFSTLTKLEYLSLAENSLYGGDTFSIVASSPFADLHNLKILNLTNNHNLRELKGHFFYGLSPSCDVITRGIFIDLIFTGIFAPFSPAGYASDFVESWNSESTTGIGTTATGTTTSSTTTTSTMKPYSPSWQWELPIRPYRSTDPKDRYKVCIENGTVISLDVPMTDEVLATGCKIDNMMVTDSIVVLYMNAIGITGFAKDWYRLHNRSPVILEFWHENISQITPELLNDLPSSVKTTVLIFNKIERLDNGTIDNAHLTTLDLRFNRIGIIENGAFDKLSNIEIILLNNNRLKSMNFVGSLPTSLERLHLKSNEITEIPIDLLSKFAKLSIVELTENKIKKIERRTFRGLSSLQDLRLDQNRLEFIESGACKDLKALRVFRLNDNNITSLEVGSFTGLEIIDTLHLGMNKFTEFPKSAVSELPSTLEILGMNNNEIELLDHGTFANVPKSVLLLSHNKIRKIEPGTFDLPQLTSLDLTGNLLSEIDGDTFQGLPKLTDLSLSSNSIVTLRKVAKNFHSLEQLDLSNNPLKRLENGSLLGLTSSRLAFMNTMNTTIELIQGGVFNDL